MIIAGHSDRARRLLARPAKDEADSLSNIRYHDNRMVLHCRARQMPQRKACWSSGVYKADISKSQTAFGVTAGMNRLQNIKVSDPLVVIRNSSDPVREGRRLFDRSRLAASLRLPLRAPRTIALIHCTALRLTLKIPFFRPSPAPPMKEVS